MSLLYHFNGLDFKSKQDLYNLKKMKTLKDLALEHNNRSPYVQKIHNLNRFSSKNSLELCDILWEKWGGDGNIYQNAIKQAFEKHNIETILNMYEYEPGTPPGSPPKKKFDTLTPTPASDSKTELIFNFVDSNIDSHIKINLTDDNNTETDSDFSPEDLLKLVNTDDFCIQIANSLKKLYKEKEKKYKTMQNHSISASPIINTAFITKAKTLSKLAREKYDEFNESENKVILIRKKLIRVITDEKMGILSINLKSIRHQLCTQIFILSKGPQPFINTFMNIVFSGTQKIELAKKYAYVFQNIGVLLGGEVIITSPKDMIEQTDIKSVGVLMKGLENIIFVDEINSNVMCFEQIAKIVHFLNKYTGMSIMMVSGYQKDMDEYFLTETNNIYSSNDLLNIFITEISKKLGSNPFTKKIGLYIYTLIVNISSQNKKLLSNQNDMIDLSIVFLNLYYRLKSQNSIDNILIVNQTFKRFLINKGLNLVIKHQN
jgi:hypothetical protein